MLSHNSLFGYYTGLFDMQHRHGWNIKDIESMIPFERDIYMQMLVAALESEKNDLETI